MTVEPKGVPISDWSWWAGDDDSVSDEGMYNLNEAGSLEDLLEWASSHVDPGEKFHVIEARCRALMDDDEFQPFAQTRNHAVYVINEDGDAVEVPA